MAGKSTGEEKISRIEMSKRRFSHVDKGDEFQTWKNARRKRKLEQDEVLDKEQVVKKIRCPRVMKCSNRFNLCNTNQTNISSYSLMSERDHWASDGRVVGKERGQVLLKVADLCSQSKI